jgi:nucleoid DNA-binding protein
MVVQREIRNVVKILATKYNLSYQDTLNIVWSQYGYVHDVIESAEKNNVDTFDNVQLKGLGTFYVSKKHVEFLKKKSNEKHN